VNGVTSFSTALPVFGTLGAHGGVEREETMPDYFEFEVELTDVEPRMWRRFLLPKDATFLDLHEAIQDACGWENCHMFNFFVKRPYGESLAGMPDGSGMSDHDIPDGSRKELSSYFGTGKGKKKTCGYVYDFGDDWRHKVKLKRTVKLEDSPPRVLLAGERAFPPEDCGGIWGYETCVEIATGQAKPDPSDPYAVEEIEERREWLGDWDPEEFDLEAVKEKFDKGRAAFGSTGVFRILPDGTVTELDPEEADDLDETLLRLISAAEARTSTEFWQSPIPCFAPSKGKPCRGRLEVKLSDDNGEVHWRCPNCNDEGHVTLGDEWGVSGPRRQELAPRDKLLTIRAPYDEYDAFADQFSLSGQAADALFAAGWDGEKVTIEATREVLVDIVEGVAAEANHARDRRRKLLDSLADRIEKALD